MKVFFYLFSYLMVKSNLLSLTIKVIKHFVLNTDEYPCDSTVKYDVLSCVEKGIISKVGCRPPWINSSSIGKICSYNDDSKLLRQYMTLMSDVTFMGPERLYSYYGCKRPCIFFEYKVKSFKYIYPDHQIICPNLACRRPVDVEVRGQ